MSYKPKLVSLRSAKTHAFTAMCQQSDTAGLHGDCSSPKFLELVGAKSVVLSRMKEWKADGAIDYAPGWGHIGSYQNPDTHTVYVSVRCRKCPECLEQRRKQWTAKAIVEVRRVPRTWFVTLTCGPDVRVWAEYRARARLEDNLWGRSWEAWNDNERFRAIERELAPEVTKWLKRVRKNSGARLRYLLVSERHKDGFPHYHALVHETAGSVTKRHLQRGWRYGFSGAKLLDVGDVRGVGYACKYLSKSALTRVRASQRYGRIENDAHSEPGVKTGDAAEQENPRLSGAIASIQRKLGFTPTSV